MDPLPLKPPSDDVWTTFLTEFRSNAPLTECCWSRIFGPLQRPQKTKLVLVGQLGQSLDGRIATPTGHSKYINGPTGLEHLHRLRALVDGVLVGVTTALVDDPMLTVRLVQGPVPARIVLDPSGKIPRSAKVWANDSARRIIITTEHAHVDIPEGVEHLKIPLKQGQISPNDIIEALAGLGLRRVLIEGGANTIARFISAQLLDHLHLIVAPIILGSGRTGINLKEIDRIDQALRPVVRSHTLGNETLFDCDFGPQ